MKWIVSPWRRGLLPSHGTRLPQWLYDLAPPLAVRWLRDRFSEWEYLPDGWREDERHGQAWNDPSLANAQEDHWRTLVANLEGPGPLGVSHFVRSTTRDDRADHNAMLSYGYVLARAAHDKDRISILDWGGSLGHYYLYSRALMPDLALDYCCHDVAQMCEVGRRLLPEVEFCENGEAALRRRYDLVLASSSLHYFRDWRSVGQSLAAATGDFLYVARLQTAMAGGSFAVVQRPRHRAYRDEFPSWFISRRELLTCFEESGLELVRELVYAEGWSVRGAPERGDCRGFLFRRR